MKNDRFRSSLIELQSFPHGMIDVEPIFCVLMSLLCFMQVLCMTRYTQVDHIRIPTFSCASLSWSKRSTDTGTQLENKSLRSYIGAFAIKKRHVCWFPDHSNGMVAHSQQVSRKSMSTTLNVEDEPTGCPITAVLPVLSWSELGFGWGLSSNFSFWHFLVYDFLQFPSW